MDVLVATGTELWSRGKIHVLQGHFQRRRTMTIDARDAAVRAG